MKHGKKMRPNFDIDNAEKTSSAIINWGLWPARARLGHKSPWNDLRLVAMIITDNNNGDIYEEKEALDYEDEPWKSLAVDALRPTISLIPLDKFVGAGNLFPRDVTVSIRPYMNMWKKKTNLNWKRMKSTCFCSMNRSFSVICPLSKTETADGVQMTYKGLRVTRMDVLWGGKFLRDDKLSEICRSELLRAMFCC